jgi:predicted nucleic acid-binding protein
MNVVDSSGWLEYLADASNADFFARAIDDIDHVLVPTVVITEVARRVWQQRGREAAREAISLVRRGRFVPMDDDIAWLAAELGIEHRLPLADSIIYATARAHDAVVWTQDRDFEGLPGVEYSARP